MAGRLDSRWGVRAQGLAGIVVVGLAIAGLLGTYLHAFDDTVEVTVRADAAGLLLERGSQVRVDGLPIGEVRKVELAPDGRSAELTVAVAADRAAAVPRDARARIEATTVFGVKYVALVAPRGGSASTAVGLRSGQVIPGTGATPEVNDVFDHAMRLLTAVPVADLARTLTSVADALRGRGDVLGAYLADTARYLAVLNGHLPTLQRDLRSARPVLDTYAEVTPALVSALDQAATTGTTLADREREVDAVLSSVSSGSVRIAALVDVLTPALKAAVTEALPLSSLLAEFAPGLGCLIGNLADISTRVARVVGDNDPGVQANVGFLPGQAAYSPLANLPQLVTGVGPTCYSMPTAARPIPPHVRFDDGTRTVYDGIGPTIEPGVPYPGDAR